MYIDDLLICASSKSKLEAALATCKRVCAALGLPLNDKTTGPCAPHEGIKYLGYFIRTSDCSITVCEEHREYAVDRLRHCLKEKAISLSDLESLAGVLSWISHAFIPGRPRRDALYSTVARMKKNKLSSVRIRGALSQQLHWWMSTLRRPMRATSFFWCTQPRTPIICSDASGDDGWGVCTMGYHIVGPWPRGWRQSDGDGTKNMLLKEVIPPTVTVLLTAHCHKDETFCSAVDNSGAAFVINALTCNCPWTRMLLRALTDSLAAHHVNLVGGHARRHLNVHTDTLSHSLDDAMWSQIVSEAKQVKGNRLELHFALLDIRRQECVLGTISFARPTHPPAKNA